MNAPLSEAEAHAKVSVKENRVYVGNLPYNCTYQDLKNALKEGGWIFGL
jgi:RNA recognition motif-containing protein